MAVRTAAHMAHLTTRSYAQHVALGDFYPALTDLTDRYAEVFMGMNRKIPKFPDVQPLSYADPLELVEDYLELIHAEQAEDEKRSEAMENILAELEELTAQTAYKLRFLK